jgi:hypothetical protein
LVAERVKEPHNQFIIREDSPDDLDIRTAVDALIAGYTTLINSLWLVVVCRAHGLTTPTLNGRQNQQQDTLLASLEPWLSCSDNISVGRIAT